MKKNTFNRICAAILAIVTVFLLIPAGVLPTFAETPKIWNGTIASGFASGTGTESDPYIIKTAEQLAYLAKTVNDGTTYEGEYFKLGNDIVLNDTSNWENWGTTAPKNTWTAIGRYSSKYPFSGTFDGDGHTVSGIYVYTEADVQGLFGYANNAVIKNLGVEKSYIKGGDGVGGVVGFSKGTVINCYNTGTVSGEGDVGGVVGVIGNGMVSDCYNTGEVSGDGYYVGGVVGGNDDMVRNCYNTGEVSGGNTVGGVVGNNYSIINCYNTGTVSGSYDYIGGVVGYNYGTVRNCYYHSGCAKDGNGAVQDGIGNGADASGQTTGLTDAQMKQKTSFAGFDFETVWTIGVIEGYDYPTLKWQTESDKPTSVWNGTIASGFASGTGTESDPYIIKTAEQLAYLAKTVNDGTTYEGEYFKLGNDIVLNDTSNWEKWDTTAPKNTWTAIGGYSDSSEYPFSGTFDGDGHTVSGI